MEVKYIQHCGDDLVVVNAARVSFKKESEWHSYGEGTLQERDAKLINYLAKNEHFSPFNHTFITLHVKAPIFVRSQLVKHKFMPINEVSRRYVDDEPEFYLPAVWRKRAENVKQGSSDEEVDLDFIYYHPEQHCLEAVQLYKELLDEGVCPEQARMILPQNTYTEFYWSGTLGAWASMYLLRSKPESQFETRLIANQAGEILSGLFPVSFKALTS